MYVQELNYQVTSITDLTPKYSTFSIDDTPLRIEIGGLYNIYNALTAFAVGREFNVDPEKIKTAFESNAQIFGRQEALHVDGKDVTIVLIKNPVGTNSVIDMMVTEKDDFSLLALLNANYADGIDTSWIWDAEFEKLHDTHIRRAENTPPPAEKCPELPPLTGQLTIGRVEPTYDRGVVAADLGALLPGELADTLRAGLRAYERKIAGYTAPEAVLTGLETRTSSPVRLKREENFESAQLAGLYPCGEGAGYAGGIMSAAVDGLRVARAIIGRYRPAEG